MQQQPKFNPTLWSSTRANTSVSRNADSGDFYKSSWLMPALIDHDTSNNFVIYTQETKLHKTHFCGDTAVCCRMAAPVYAKTYCDKG